LSGRINCPRRKKGKKGVLGEFVKNMTAPDEKKAKAVKGTCWSFISDEEENVLKSSSLNPST